MQRPVSERWQTVLAEDRLAANCEAKVHLAFDDVLVHVRYLRLLPAQLPALALIERSAESLYGGIHPAEKTHFVPYCFQR